MKSTFCLKTVTGVVASVVGAALISPNVWAASCNPKAEIHQIKASTIKQGLENASKKDLDFLLCMTPEKEDRQVWTEQWQKIKAVQKAAQKRYARSPDGKEVTDNNTGLVWRRCSEGQTWNGTTCTGSARQYTYEQALARAQTQTGWRLPSKEELSSIVDSSRNHLAIDTAAFPGTVAGAYWTSSPYTGNAGSALGVGLYFNDIDGDARGVAVYVRLVR